ncbi:hypothetical protein BX285_7093 [Streptomyces sp. 1114.5]|uniref:DUF6817 domain-containing protein n=1 Tax=Streptomyces sp. 1114.5 TaxID=1938830 RepID=UPI000F2905E1|nr:hypothetical protein [Streptomyces sp. 1114.5]RKT08728.1 hypothetical protein BX285_7093 [Streptomyces sp. 1114.5]
MTPSDHRGIPDRDRIEDFLHTHGADRIPHPGGTLLVHLRRVAALLATWGCAPAVQAAGLCHAAYGTDGFDRTLLALDRRSDLAELVGLPAEALVHLYASCDRAATYPRLGTDERPLFRDRFTGDDHTPTDEDLRAFLAVTAANELDVLAHNAELATRHGPALYGLFARVDDLLPPTAWQACIDLLGPDATDRPRHN